MRVLVPYVTVAPETRCALLKHAKAHQVEYVYVGEDDLAYGRLLERVWSEGETFMIVEQDIEVGPKTVDELADCECEYGCFPYVWTTNTGPALGCTRWRADLLAAHPDAVEQALAIPSHWGRPGHWRSLDVALMRNVLRDSHGLQPHVHLPPVTHLNPKQRLLPAYCDRPVDSCVLGRPL